MIDVGFVLGRLFDLSRDDGPDGSPRAAPGNIGAAATVPDCAARRSSEES